MRRNRNRYLMYVALGIAFFVASPLDDIIIASLFGTTLFGFGTIRFYLLLAIIAVPSVVMWRRHSLKHSQQQAEVTTGRSSPRPQGLSKSARIGKTVSHILPNNQNIIISNKNSKSSFSIPADPRKD